MIMKLERCRRSAYRSLLAMMSLRRIAAGTAAGGNLEARNSLNELRRQIRFRALELAEFEHSRSPVLRFYIGLGRYDLLRASQALVRLAAPRVTPPNERLSDKTAAEVGMRVGQRRRAA
jgi:hypothetical protein